MSAMVRAEVTLRDSRVTPNASGFNPNGSGNWVIPRKFLEIIGIGPFRLTGGTAGWIALGNCAKLLRIGERFFVCV